MSDALFVLFAAAGARKTPASSRVPPGRTKPAPRASAPEPAPPQVAPPPADGQRQKPECDGRPEDGAGDGAAVVNGGPPTEPALQLGSGDPGAADGVL